MSQYDIKITGKDLKRFIKNLAKAKININKITYINKSIIIRINKEDYKKLMQIKTIYKIEIVRLYGIVKYINLVKSFKITIITIIIGLITTYFLSNIIFKINVINNSKEIRNLIYEELEKNNIKKFSMIKKFNTQEEIVNKIINNNRNKIEWMEIKRNGVLYEIKVEERKIKRLEENNTPRNIIAKKDGFITDININKGNILVSKGSYVKKGDILVSGIIMNKDTIKGKVHSEGTILAETWYTVTVELPYHYSEKKYTNQKQKVLSINFFTKKINIFSKKKYQNKETTPIKEFKNNILPISIGIYNEKEIEIINKNYTKENAINEANKIARKKLTEKLNKNDSIIYEKDLKITEENSKINIEVFFKVKEDITDYEEISLEKIEG